MKAPLVAATAAFGLLLASCGGDASTGADPSPDADPSDELAMVDLTDAAQEITANNEPLDDLCRRLYADAEVRSDISIGLVADVGSIDDGTFNQAAYEGMEAAGRCFGVATTFLESAGERAADEVATMVARDVDVVVTVGFQFQEATAAAAESRPDLHFVGVDQANPDGVANYVAISFEDLQVGFLAGAMAALLTESDTVAIVAGPDTIPPVVAIADGFEAGVGHVSSDVVVLREHLDSFNDPPAGVEAAERFVDEGADVIFAAAGDTGTGATLAASGMGALVIGVDQDEYYTTFAGGATPNADQLVTSAIKRVDLGVFLTIAALSTGELEGGELRLDASNGGVGYAPFHEAEVPADVADEIERLRLGLATGEIDPAGR